MEAFLILDWAHWGSCILSPSWSYESRFWHSHSYYLTKRNFALLRPVHTVTARYSIRPGKPATPRHNRPTTSQNADLLDDTSFCKGPHHHRTGRERGRNTSKVLLKSTRVTDTHVTFYMMKSTNDCLSTGMKGQSTKNVLANTITWHIEARKLCNSLAFRDV